MNRSRVLILLLFILLVSGCTDFFMICSLNPFYLDKNITLVPEIEGRWGATPLRNTASSKDMDKEVWNKTDTSSVWKIERRIARDTYKNKQGKDSVVVRPMDYYHITLISSDTDTTKYSFKMVVFRIKNVLYADFMPMDNTGMEKYRLASENYFKIHTLARLIIRNNQPELSWLGAEYMKEMIESKRVRVSYRWVKDAKRLLLTGSSEQLTGMIERYANEPRFINWDQQPAKLRLNRIN
jgi:hypothetical protein